MAYTNPAQRQAQRVREGDAARYNWKKRQDQHEALRRQGDLRNKDILNAIATLKASRTPVTTIAVASLLSCSRTTVRKGLIQLQKQKSISSSVIHEIQNNGRMAALISRDEAYQKKCAAAVRERKDKILRHINKAKSKHDRLPFTTDLAELVCCHRATILLTLNELLEEGELSDADLYEIKGAVRHGIAGTFKTGVHRNANDRDRLVLDQVLEAQQQGVAPTVAELAAWTDYPKQSIYSSLLTLEARGQVMVAGKNLSPRPWFVLALVNA